MKRISSTVAITLLAGLFAMSGMLAAQQGNANVALRAAMEMEMETVNGDLRAAINAYKKIAQGSDRPVAAKALWRMAECYQKLGDAEATRVYEQIVRDFSDQPEAAQARARLADAPGRPGRSNSPRLVDGNSRRGRLSMDARTMVFVQSGQVTTKDLASGKITPITLAAPLTQRTQHWPTSPVLSPDSQQIAYAEEFSGAAIEFRVVSNKAGATPRVLFRHPEFLYLQSTAWSLDGKAVLTTMLKRDNTWQLAWVSTATGAITVLESLEWRYNDEYDVVNLSPDGRYVAYSALAVNPTKAPTIEEQRPLQRHVYLLASDGSSRTELIKVADGRKPVWSPDSAHVVFLSDLSGTSGLWSIPVRAGKAAGGPSIVRAGMDNLHPIAITRAGTFYYSRWMSGYPVTSIENSNGASARASDVFVGGNAVWSPDGSAIAMTKRKPGGQGGFNLVVHSFETGEDLLFASGAGGGHLWFHDRRRLLVGVADASQGGRPAWYAVDPKAGTSTRVLAADPLRGRVLGLSNDDKTVYSLERQAGDAPAVFQRLVATDLATGQSREVFDFSSLPALGSLTNRQSGGSMPSTVLSPDGRTLAFQTSNDVEAQLGLILLELGKYQELYRGPTMTNVGLQWVNDGKYIAWGETVATAPPQARGRMMRMSIAGGLPEFTGIEFDDGWVPKISPDGSRIARGRNVPPTSELWALDNVTSLLKGPSMPQRDTVISRQRPTAVSPAADIEFGRWLSQQEIDALPEDPASMARELEIMSGFGMRIQLQVDGVGVRMLPPKEQIRAIQISRRPFGADTSGAVTIFNIVTF